MSIWSHLHMKLYSSYTWTRVFGHVPSIWKPEGWEILLGVWKKKRRAKTEDEAFLVLESLNQPYPGLKHLFLTWELVFLLCYIYPCTFIDIGNSSALITAISKMNYCVLGKESNKTSTALVLHLGKISISIPPEMGLAIEYLSMKTKKTLRRRRKGHFQLQIPPLCFENCYEKEHSASQLVWVLSHWLKKWGAAERRVQKYSRQPTGSGLSKVLHGLLKSPKRICHRITWGGRDL